MTPSLLDTIDAFAKLRVLVIGEAMLDSYLHGSVGRLCREAPVPVVEMSDREDVPGGGANTAANVRSLGAEVDLLSVVGAEAEVDSLISALEARGVRTGGLIRDPERKTLLKQRVLAASHLLLRLDSGSTGGIGEDAEKLLLSNLTSAWGECDAVIVSDYGYGVLTEKVIARLAELQSKFPRVLVVETNRHRILEVRPARRSYRTWAA